MLVREEWLFLSPTIEKNLIVNWLAVSGPLTPLIVLSECPQKCDEIQAGLSGRRISSTYYDEIGIMEEPYV